MISPLQRVIGELGWGDAAVQQEKMGVLGVLKRSTPTNNQTTNRIVDVALGRIDRVQPAEARRGCHVKALAVTHDIYMIGNQP